MKLKTRSKNDAARGERRTIFGVERIHEAGDAVFFAFGAKTPWYLVKFCRGGGTKGASFRTSSTAPHDLPMEFARQAADRALEEYSVHFADYDPRVTWADETTAHIESRRKASHSRGSLRSFPTPSRSTWRCPCCCAPFKNTVISVVERKIRDWIGKAKEGSLA